jgi:hypothetical protein
VLTFPFIFTAWIMMYSEWGWVKVRKRDEDRENVAPARRQKKARAPVKWPSLRRSHQEALAPVKRRQPPSAPSESPDR